MDKNIVYFTDRKDWRNWLSNNFEEEKEVWFTFPTIDSGEIGITYNDAVEEALCFGWIDSIAKEVDGKVIQRFSPRKKRSPWTELNKERARRLIKLGLMTKEGKKVLPKLGKNSYKIPSEIIEELKKGRCLTKFKAFPPLYQRVRAYNIMFYKDIDEHQYKKALHHLIVETKKNHMYGEWNDYGRLINY